MEETISDFSAAIIAVASDKLGLFHHLQVVSRNTEAVAEMSSTVPGNSLGIPPICPCRLQPVP